jgi:putative transposase
LEYRSTKHCKYNINYHLVWCPKYRHRVLTNDIDNFLKGSIQEICNNYDYELLNIEIMPDHLHLFVSAVPYVSPTEIVKTIKSITASKIFKQFPKLKSKKFWRSGLWSKGYFVGTAGTVTAETIQRYIDEQKTKSE